MSTLSQPSSLGWRLGGTGMVVDVCLSPVLILRVPVWDVHVLQRRVVVLVRVVGLQMTPVLPPVQVVGDVEMLVPMLNRVMLVMTLRSRHCAHHTFQTIWPPWTRPYTGRSSRTNGV